MEEADIPQTSPYIETVEEGQTYLWCACGKSKKQPFCDGSHAGTGFAPVVFKAPASKNVMFCGCKRTRKAPLCDGAHNSL